MRENHSLIALSAVVLFACGGDDLKAEATIAPKSGSTVTGSALFTQDGETVTLVVNVAGATPGLHGFHLHQVGDCSSDDGMSAGPHWNPTNAMHGMPGSADHHYGDTGNVEVGADGTGTFTFTSNIWKIASTSTVTDVVGRSVIFHEKPDDFGQPAGNAGAREGCGVIRNTL